jgi:tRNA-dihydrouridine synthase B
MFDETGCDAVMVGRAAHGNPWFFRDAKARLNGEPNPPSPSLIDIANMCSRHFDLLLENRGERIGTNLMRKHFSNYIKGFPGASAFRQKLVTAPGLPEMRSALSEFIEVAQKVKFELG